MAADLRGALAPVQVKHCAVVTEPAKLAELLRQLDDYQGSFIVKEATSLTPLLFVRPGELRRAKGADYQDKLKAGTDLTRLHPAA